MILQALYEYAHSRKLLQDTAFYEKSVRWIIDLDQQGNLLGVGPVDTSVDGKHGKVFSCPKTSKNKNAGGVAEFLADGMTALFGLESNLKEAKKKSESERQKRELNNTAKCKAFRNLIESCSREVPFIKPCLLFLDKVQGIPTFLCVQDDKWMLTPASAIPLELKADNFSFRINGKLVFENQEVCDWWRRQYRKELAETAKNVSKGRCIVTGKAGQPILDSHTIKIMNVPGGQSTGASLISFDKDAFQSYGFKNSQNCPTSQEAADAYCIALNALIGSNETSLRISKTTVLCFWTKEIPEMGFRMGNVLNKPTGKNVADFLKTPWSGLPKEAPKSDTFYSIVLKGCSGRVAVSQWIQEPIEQAVQNLQHWFLDLHIYVPSRPPSNNEDLAQVSIYRLAMTTVREKKKDSASKGEDPRPETITQLYRAAVDGFDPSLMLLSSILARLSAKLSDKDYRLIYDEARFSLIKLILNRNRKDSDMEVKSTLTTNTSDLAYNCGRLLAVLSATQKKAQGYPKGFAGVAERYFASASTSPSSVFPMLLQLNRHHLDKIRKMGNGNVYEEIAIRDIISNLRPNGELPPEFPTHLNLQGQGRFAIGFYQQQAEDEYQRRGRTVFKFLEEGEQYLEVLESLRQMQGVDNEAFRKEVDAYYWSPECQKWRKEKRTAAEQLDVDKEASQLALDLCEE